MAYSELIKNFSRIRDYMRDFYIYGFKRRKEYDEKSARSYDNERRRIESWLGAYMAFGHDCDGKRVFISIDSRSITGNPIYKAFKAKSFTAKDITLNFFILDVMGGGVFHTVSELTDILDREYMSWFAFRPVVDESTVRLKLKEYVKLGLLISEKRGKQLYYGLSSDNAPLCDWKEALAFFSEEDPLGVIGSYLLDKLRDTPGYFRFKHHYMLHALESEVLCQLLAVIDEQRAAQIDIYNPRRGKASAQPVTPLKILVSTQGGRRYLLAYVHAARHIKFYRLDSIKAVKPRGIDHTFDTRRQQAVNFMGCLWGVSAGSDASLDHIEMTVYAGQDEGYIPERLEREKRCGTVTALGNNLYRFTADVYDAAEMLPWIRTFTGRIAALECSNNYVRETFLRDLRAMESIYRRGISDVVS